jgi:radical SAM protein with 4Fe4S-binding SPASM domain
MIQTPVQLRRLRSYAEVFLHWKVWQHVELPYLPTEISLEITNRCNFKCAFCPQSKPTYFDLVPRMALTIDGARTLLAKLRTGGITTNLICWTLDGEPFMNQQFDGIVKTAVEFGFTTHHFATNGYFVTPERLATFPYDRAVFFLAIDFCSDETYFETYRGTPGSWRCVKDNVHHVLNDYRFRNFHFKLTDISSYTVTDPETLQRRFKAMKALFPKTHRLTFHHRVFHNMTGLTPIMKKSKKSHAYNLCPYPWFSLRIASDGAVVACCRDLEHKTVLGNLYQQELAEIWNGAKYKALRQALVERRPGKVAACVECDMPYDDSKFSVRNIVKSLVHRALVLK